MEKLNVEINNAKNTKAGIERARALLEKENAELDKQLKQMSAARGESERKRKQLEAQIVGLRDEIDKNKSGFSEKATNLQVIS